MPSTRLVEVAVKDDVGSQPEIRILSDSVCTVQPVTDVTISSEPPLVDWK